MERKWGTFRLASHFDLSPSFQARFFSRNAKPNIDIENTGDDKVIDPDQATITDGVVIEIMLN